MQKKTLTALAAALVAAAPVFAQTSGSAAATGIAPADGSNKAAQSGSLVQSGTGTAVTSGTGGVVTTPSTTVLGVGPAPTTVVTTSARTWPEFPANVEARKDFQRHLRLK